MANDITARHYENMQESGVEWIGMVPTDWKICRGKVILKPLQRKVLESDEVITCFRDGEVTLRKNRREDGFTNSILEIGYQGIEPGDLVVHGMDGFAGAIGISDSRGKASPVLNVLDSLENKRYLMYYLRMLAYRDVFVSLATGIRIRSCDLRWNKLANLPFLLPDRGTQEKIAKFLDNKCFEIENTIANIKSTIAEYKDWKSSIIHEAVTKGLNPNVEMKVSGIEWIGKIPNHWNTTKIGNFVSIRSGITLGKRYTSEKALIARPYLRVANVKADRLALDDVATIMVTPEEAKKYELVPGELLMTEGGDRDKLGRGTIWNGEIPGCLHQNHVFAVHVNEKYMLTKYLDYLTTSPVGREYFDLTAKKTTNLASTNSSTILRFTVPVPPISEQRDIVAMLDTKCKILDEIIQEKEALVRDLDAYKKSLIYEVVTGKRKIC